MASFAALSVTALHPKSRPVAPKSSAHANIPAPICIIPAARRQRTLRSVKVEVAKYKGTQIKEKQLTEMIEKKVIEARQACEGDESSDECKVAWDEVEEVSQAKADLRLRLQKEDPLQSYCEDNPETDECRIYED